MKAFWSLIRRTMRHRWLLSLSLLCSLMIGVLWGANISVLYPILDVVFRGESLSQSLQRKIDEGQKRCIELTDSIDQLKTEIVVSASPERENLLRQQASLQRRLDAERSALAISYRSKPLVDHFLPSDPFWMLLVIVSVLLVGTMLKGGFMVANDILVARMTHRTIFELRKEFYRRTLRMDINTIEKDRSSRLMSRFTHDVTHVSEGLQVFFGRVLREPIKIIVCLSGAAFICWRLLLVSLVFVPLGVLLMKLISRGARRTAASGMDAMADLYAHLSESFRGIKAVKACNMERHERRKFHHIAKNLLRRRMRAVVYRAFIGPLSELMGMASVATAILVGAYLVINRETQVLGITLTSRPMSATSLMLFYGFLLGVTDPFRKLSGVSIQLIRSAAAAERVYRLMQREPKIKSPDNPLPLPANPEKLVIDQVKFRYRHGETVLKDINLEIPIGKTLAVVGPNGCGKSTLVNLIPRFYQPNKGSIRLDSVDIRQFRLSDWRRQIAIVSQETLLFDDTVIYNIRYGSPNASHAQAVEAAGKARAHQFITTELEDGYDTIIGEDGSILSGGQRQRITLARAFLRRPQILILDEAMNQIDATTSKELQTELSTLMGQCTIIIVTHRATDIAMADCIAVMKKGRIVDSGTHAELINRCGLYRALCIRDKRSAA